MTRKSREEHSRPLGQKCESASHVWERGVSQMGQSRGDSVGEGRQEEGQWRLDCGVF